VSASDYCKGNVLTSQQKDDSYPAKTMSCRQADCDRCLVQQHRCVGNLSKLD